MKQVNGTEALKQLLIITKKINEIEQNLTKLSIFCDDIELCISNNLFEIICKLIGYPKNPNYVQEFEDWMNNHCKGEPPANNDWIYDIITRWCDNELTLEDTTNLLLED